MCTRGSSWEGPPFASSGAWPGRRVVLCPCVWHPPPGLLLCPAPSAPPHFTPGFSGTEWVSPLQSPHLSAACLPVWGWELGLIFPI